MHKSLLLIVMVLLQSAWSIMVVESRASENRWFFRFFHVPSAEHIGGLKTIISVSDGIDVAGILTDAPPGGAWSQIKPEVSRNGNRIEVVSIGPAMLDSRISDTIEMFTITLEISGESRGNSQIRTCTDSIRFSECIDTRGATMVPLQDYRKAALNLPEKPAGHAATTQCRRIGRTHSLTFNLGKQEMVKARVVDVKGRMVTRLAEQIMPSGMHTLRWPGNDRQIVTGTYFILLEINNFTYNKKVSYYR